MVGESRTATIIRINRSVNEVVILSPDRVAKRRGNSQVPGESVAWLQYEVSPVPVTSSSEPRRSLEQEGTVDATV